MNKIMCQWHNLSLSLVIMHQDKAELICEECYVNLMEGKKQSEVDHIIYLKKANNCPAYLLSKSKMKQCFPQFLDNIQQFDENELKKQFTILEKKIRVIQKTLESVVEEIKTQVQTVIQNRQEIVEQLKKAVKFQSFQQLISELGQQNDNMNPDVVNQIEIKFFQYFQIMQNEQFENLKKQISQIIENKALQQSKAPKKQNQQMHEQFKNLAIEFNEQHQQFITSTSPNFESFLSKFNDSKLISYDFEFTIRNQIESKSKKYIEKVQQIYLGSRDGLNQNSFWAKVNGKRNLLMIFKSRSNNQVFGGYTPCLWSQVQNYVQDDSISSFLFSQDYKLILPLKPENKHQAIYCHSTYGPTFGGGHDLYISSNFQSGQSNLGHSYLMDEKQYGNQRSTLLFGAQPNLAECEIYEITFQQ